MSLQRDLPLEVLNDIVSHLSVLSDLGNLCAVSRSLNNVITPKLYESVTLQVFPELLDCLKLRDFPKRYLTYTKRLRFFTSTRARSHNECLHPKYSVSWNLEDGMSMSNMDNTLMNAFGEAVARFCSYIPRDQLVEFRWDVGTCVPPQVLGAHGCLSTKQRKVQQFNLLTSGRCLYSQEVDFHLPNSVKKFSWIGPNRPGDFEAVEKCLNANAAWLEELELGQFPYAFASDHSAEDNRSVLLQKILELPDSSPTALFPSLRHLTFTRIIHDDLGARLLNAFGFNQLRSLSLRSCPAVYELLRDLERSSLTLQLNSFQLDHYIGNEWREFSAVERIEAFLRSFDSLRDVYLLLYVPLAGEDIHSLVDAIVTHKQNLQKVVIHLRSVGEDDSDSDEDYVEDIFIKWNDSYMPLINCSKLEYFGGSFSPASMQHFLTAENSKPPWKILHLRLTREVGPRPEDIGIPESSSHLSELLGNDSGDQNAAVPSVSIPSYAEMISPSEAKYRLEALEFVDLDHAWLRDPHVIGLDVDIDDFASTLDEEVRCRRLSRVSINFYKFAQWAFGPEGLPELQLLAIGDFSERGFRNVVLSRNWVKYHGNSKPVLNTQPVQLNFRALSKDEVSLLDLLRDNLNFLVACEGYRAWPGLKLDFQPGV